MSVTTKCLGVATTFAEMGAPQEKIPEFVMALEWAAHGVDAIHAHLKKIGVRIIYTSASGKALRPWLATTNAADDLCDVCGHIGSHHVHVIADSENAHRILDEFSRDIEIECGLGKQPLMASESQLRLRSADRAGAVNDQMSAALFAVGQAKRMFANEKTRRFCGWKRWQDAIAAWGTNADGSPMFPDLLTD